MLVQDIRDNSGDDIAVVSGLKLLNDRILEADGVRNQSVWNAYVDLSGKKELKCEG